MNSLQQEILKEIEKAPKYPAGNFKGNPFDLNKYLGSPHKLNHLNTPGMQKIAKEWRIAHKDIKAPELFEFLTILFESESFDEKMIAAYILEFLPQQRQEIDLSQLDRWLNRLVGWAEIDTIGTGPFEAKDMLDKWETWQKWLKKWSEDENVNKRRFSLVVLIIPVRDSVEQKLAEMAFENIDKLKSEKDILTTKAVSWILRGLIKNHRHQVEEYLDQNFEILPKITVREVKNKLATGRK